MSRRISTLLSAAVVTAVLQVSAATITLTVSTAGDGAGPSGTVTTGTFVQSGSGGAGDLRGCLNFINSQAAGNTYNIVFTSPVTSPITLNGPLPPINFPLTGSSLATNTVVIDGSGITGLTINGATNNFRPFFAYQGNVTLQNMTISGSAVGGTGGAFLGSGSTGVAGGAGGGGMGAGGALFIDGAAVTINNITFSGCKAQGGGGAAVGAAGSAGGGGGGMGGAGGSVGSATTAGGGNTGYAGGGAGGGWFGAGGPGNSTSGTTGHGGGGGGGGMFAFGATGGAMGTATQSSGGGGGGGYGGSGTTTSTGAGGGTGGTSTAGAGAAGGAGGQVGSPAVSIGGGGGGGAGGGTSGAGGQGAIGAAGGGTAGVASAGGSGGGVSGAAGTAGVGGLGGLGGGGGGAGFATGLNVGLGGGGGLGGGAGGGTGGIATGQGGLGGYGGGGGGNAGLGGFGGGGGGAASPNVANTALAVIKAGNGGFGGGGGGGSSSGTTSTSGGGGNGGFGGGAGGANGNTSTAVFGTAGIGGGTSTANTMGGGGGAALGAAIFLCAGSGSAANGNPVGGGSLTIQGGVPTGTSGGLTTTTNSSAVQGSGGTGAGAGFVAGTTAGAVAVQELFVFTNGTTQNITFNAAFSTDLITMNASIGDDNVNTISSSGTWTAGNASGGVGITKTGPGTLALLGTNTYTGINNINAGTVQVNSAAGLGNAVSPLNIGNATYQSTASYTTTRNWNVNAGTTAIFDTQTNTVTNSSGTVMLNTGSTLNKISSGTLSLGGSATVTGGGGITVTAGTLMIVSGTPNTYSGITNVVSGATLLASGVNAVSASSSHLVNGTFNLGNANQAIASLVGTNPAGIVSLGTGTLTTGSDNTTTTFAGSITGTGGVTKTGTGTMTLSGANLYTGATTVSAGTFLINGSMTSPVTVNSGGFLRGFGTITGNVTVNSGGSIRAGGSIGTMTIVGNLSLNSGATMRLEITPTTSSVYAITGNATLGGTLRVLEDAGTYGAQAYTFLTTTGTVSGTFSSITNLPSGQYGSVVYGSNYVQLLLVNPTKFATTAISTANLSSNQSNLLTYLSKFGSVPAIATILSDLGTLSPGALQSALNSISPARSEAATAVTQYAAFSMGATVTARMGENRILSHIMSHKAAKHGTTAALEARRAAMIAMSDEEMPAPSVPASMEMETMEAEIETDVANSQKDQEKEHHRIPGGKAKSMAAEEHYDFWASGFGDFIRQNGVNQNPNIHATSAGGMIGVDYFGEDGVLSISGGYLHNKVNESGNVGHATSNGGMLGLYGTGYLDDFYIELGVLGAVNRFNNTRNVNFGGPIPFSGSAKAAHTDWLVMPHLALGYDFMFHWGAIEPFVAADWAFDFVGKIKEEGAAPLNMTVNRQLNSMLRAEGGIAAYEMWETYGRDKHGRANARSKETEHLGSIWMLKEAVSYVNKQPFKTSMSAAIELAPGTAFPSGAPSSFTQQTYNKDLNLGSVSAEIFYKHKSSGFFLSANYIGEFGSGYTSNDVQGTLGIFF